MWNQLMARLECCGVNSYNDFDSSSYWLANKGSRQAPEACCKLQDRTLLTPIDSNCAYSPSDSNSYYMKVTHPEIKEIRNNNIFDFSRDATIRLSTISTTTKTWLSVWAAVWYSSSFSLHSLHSAYVSASAITGRAVVYNFNFLSLIYNLINQFNPLHAIFPMIFYV